MATIQDFLLNSTAAQVGLWVQLVNNATNVAYVSTSATGANGSFVVQQVPAGSYVLSTGATNVGPWFTLNTTYIVSNDSPIFNVMDYGAKGDGTTDDTTAINTTTTAANVAGGTVYFPKGTYIINTPVNGAPNGTLSGRPRSLLYLLSLTNVKFKGEGVSSLLKTTIAYSSTMFEVRNSTDIVFEDLSFYGNNLAADPLDASVSGSCIRYTNVNRGAVRRNMVQNCNGLAVYLTGGTRQIEVGYNQFLNNGTGAPAFANSINEDSLNGDVGGGGNNPPFGNLFIGNFMMNNTGAGAICLDNNNFDSHTRVIGNMIDNSGTYITNSFQGIRCADIRGVEIIGNTIRNIIREGIYIFSTGVHSGGFTIADNVVQSCGVALGYDGIMVDNAGHGEIRGWTIKGNLVKGCGGHGIHIAQSGGNSVRNGVIENNIVWGNDQTTPNTKDGIYVNSRSTIIMNNQITSLVGTTAHRYGLNIDAGSTFIQAPFNRMDSFITGDYNDASGSVIFYHSVNNLLTSIGASPGFYTLDVAGDVRVRAGSKLRFGGTGTGDALVGVYQAGSSLLQVDGNLSLNSAAAQIIPGATSLSLRNNANSADNVLVTDLGAVTFRAGVGGITTLSMSGALTLSAAASQIVPGATSISLRDHANANDNLVVTDAGIVTLRNNFNITGATSSTRQFAFQTAGSDRWHIRANSTAEGGANAGSDFVILSRDDTGGFLATAVQITRASGNVLLSSGAISSTVEQQAFTVAGRTTTITSGFTTQRHGFFVHPTITAGSALTVTTAATLAIDAAPTAAGSAIITNAYALWVQAGLTSLDGDPGLRFGTAISRILPGGTSLSLRNNANSADNLIIVDAGDATLRGSLTMSDAKNIVLQTTTGTQLGTATGQKLAFHGSTAVIQRAGAAQAAVVTTASTSTAPFGYATGAQADALVTLVNEIRATLVEKGLMKGAA